jgi:uncharacterized protein (TIGR00725 family)
MALRTNGVNDYSFPKVGNRIVIYGSSRTEPGSPEWTEAEKLGRLSASYGLDVVTGGYGGSMEAVSKGAREAVDSWSGGSAPPKVIGILVPGQFPDRRLVGNKYLTDSIDATGMMPRVDLLTQGARYYVALPGTVGTLQELTSIWCLHYVNPSGAPLPVIVAYRKPWEPVIQALIQGLALPPNQHKDIIRFVDSAEEVMEIIRADARSQQTVPPPESPARIE